MDCMLFFIFILSEGFDLKSRVHFLSIFVERFCYMGFMKVNSSTLGVGHDLF